MAEAIYEVNIKLNAQNFEQELNALKKKLERFTKEAKRKNEKEHKQNEHVKWLRQFTK